MRWRNGAYTAIVEVLLQLPPPYIHLPRGPWTTLASVITTQPSRSQLRLPLYGKMLLAYLLGITAALITTSTATLRLNASTVFQQKWLSVQNDFSDIGPWPILGKDNDGANNQPLTYCFKDQKTIDHLGALVLSAIEMWSPALEHSSLKIVTAKVCTPWEWHSCLCDKVPKPVDALVISDEGPPPPGFADAGYFSSGSEGDDEVEMDEHGDHGASQTMTRTTIGYDHGNRDRDRRHTMKLVMYEDALAQKADVRAR
ncbi:hypothetical protein LTR95_003648 [Oleoguttula sp. CCFEE 5521]